MTPLQKAFALVECISRALHEGVVHENTAGQELKTVQEVLRCIRDEGYVYLSGPSGPTGTSNYDILELGREATSGGRYDGLIERKVP